MAICTSLQLYSRAMTFKPLHSFEQSKEKQASPAPPGHMERYGESGRGKEEMGETLVAPTDGLTVSRTLFRIGG